MEIKTPNWRLSTTSKESTGHHYQITDRRTDSVTYFDSVKVYDGTIVNQIKFFRDDEDMGSNGARAGKIRGTDQVADIVVEALKELENKGTFTDLYTRVD